MLFSPTPSLPFAHISLRFHYHFIPVQLLAGEYGKGDVLIHPL
jgi:hypothetical protein